MSAQKAISVLSSPVDVHLNPSDQFSFDCEIDDLARFQRDNGISEIWRRDGKFIGVNPASGLKKYDFKVGEQWESMFLPNGEDTWEWRLGLNFDVPDGFSVLVFDEPALQGIEVIAGIFNERQIASINENVGISIAFKVNSQTILKRGAPIARCVMLRD